MADPSPHRRLAAILAADVVGYSRLMGADEAGTLAALKRHREQVFNPAVERREGRIVKLMGDGTLVEFSSVVDAVNCALDIQRAARASKPEGDSAIELRIGINLGDVIVEGDDIYGDGVNVAARLEPLAVPGGICVSSIVNESVGERIDVAFADAGEVSLKNISRPVRVWKWQPEAGDGAAVPEPASATAARLPSIAVLPFTNMSGDPEQEYFSDGISEDIITDLSKVGSLAVIARNSSFVYKGRSVDIRQVGRELGASAVVEGSIRKAGNRVRITAQLIDAASGNHLWAERFDRDLTDIFEVQDEVTRRIVESLKLTLTPREAERIAAAPTANLEAHDLSLRARELLFGPNRDRQMFEQVVPLARRAIELDPDYAEPHALIAWAYNLDYQNQWSGEADPLAIAERYSALAVEKDTSIAFVHYTAASIAFWKKDLDRAIAEADMAISLSPSDALSYGMRGFVAVYTGDPLAAVPLIERAMRLDPAFTHQYLHFIGSAYLVAGKYEAAAASFRERIRLTPKTDLSRGLLIAALGHLGETGEARRVWAELREISPTYSFEAHLRRLPFADPAIPERIREGFAKAGVGA